MSTDDALAEAIKQVAQARVAEALGGDVLGKMVQAVMEYRDKRYGHDNGKTFFESIVENRIECVIREAVAGVLEARKDEVSEAVKAAFARGGFDTLVGNIIGAFASDDWRATMKIEFPKE